MCGVNVAGRWGKCGSPEIVAMIFHEVIRSYCPQSGSDSRSFINRVSGGKIQSLVQHKRSKGNIVEHILKLPESRANYFLLIAYISLPNTALPPPLPARRKRIDFGLGLCWEIPL